MKILVNKSDLSEQPEMIMRRAGYTFIRDRRSGKESFARRMTRDFYPRFHVYIIDEGEIIVFNVHLDQKRASYAGSNAHSGEYDSELVEKEVERLKTFIV